MGRYSNAVQEEPPRPQWKGYVIGMTILALGLGGWYGYATRENKLATMSSATARVTRTESPLEPMTEFARATSPEVSYHVVLQGVPLGWRLSLVCQWMHPNGEPARSNVYDTLIVFKPTWPTHCRQRFSDAAPAGLWRVRLKMGDRVLSESRFVLK